MSRSSVRRKININNLKTKVKKEIVKYKITFNVYPFSHLNKTVSWNFTTLLFFIISKWSLGTMGSQRTRKHSTFEKSFDQLPLAWVV